MAGGGGEATAAVSSCSVTDDGVVWAVPVTMIVLFSFRFVKFSFVFVFVK
jgi:hypothetical protein